MLVVSLLLTAKVNAQQRVEQLFDSDWHFYRGDNKGAEAINFNDASWRPVNLPHDFSIEDLPNQQAGNVRGPFSKASIGGQGNGYTVGGTG